MVRSTQTQNKSRLGRLNLRRWRFLFSKPILNPFVPWNDPPTIPAVRANCLCLSLVLVFLWFHRFCIRSRFICPTFTKPTPARYRFIVKPMHLKGDDYA